MGQRPKGGAAETDSDDDADDGPTGFEDPPPVAGVAAPFNELPRHVHEACATTAPTVGTTRKRARPDRDEVETNHSYEDQ